MIMEKNTSLAQNTLVILIFIIVTVISSVFLIFFWLKKKELSQWNILIFVILM